MGPIDPLGKIITAQPLRLLYVEDEPGEVEIALRELEKSNSKSKL